jgi:pheromone a factor receptor
MAGSDHLFGRDGSWIVVAGEAEAITTPALTANFICRVLLATLANIICLVPLKHLYRNSEFAAVVFIVNIEVTNLDTIVNALIWRNDDTDSWWPGYGLCDLSPYIHNFNIALFVTCLLAMMRNLAQQVGLLRANPLTVREKRRRHLVQALIIFPLPIIQLCWVWPLTAQRYVVGTLVGCSWVASPSWPYIVFFVTAPVVIAIMTSGYASKSHFFFSSKLEII